MWMTTKLQISRARLLNLNNNRVAAFRNPSYHRQVPITNGFLAQFCEAGTVAATRISMRVAIRRITHSIHGCDCVIFNQDKPGLACARLRSLIRCKLPSGRITDIAIVQAMKRSSWRPRTVWDGCAVYDEKKDFSFLLMDYVIRGALLVPVVPSPPSRPHSRLHFFVDVVDGDMFLRSLNSTTHVCY
ncbi:hypothetical protein DFH08DRAFT_902012 [Mycena albidolilacea]|uniref:Uncharacterized protein n=1 Tax=Mycena albidolilacea TaxID=1033008 RepID=A0AAD6Z3K1_9AGAR|nr:hypothetical protein DFH08DRAFT_902012 [Mycena albidolilacea]